MSDPLIEVFQEPSVQSPKASWVEHVWFGGLLAIIYVSAGLGWVIHPAIWGVSLLAVVLIFTKLSVFHFSWKVCAGHIVGAGVLAFLILSGVVMEWETSAYRRLGHDRWFWLETSDRLLGLGGCQSMINLLEKDATFRAQHYQEMKAARAEVVNELREVECLTEEQANVWWSRLDQEFEKTEFLLLKNR